MAGTREVSDELERIPRSISRHAALCYLQRVSERIEELSRRRSALWSSASAPSARRKEVREIESRIEGLWETYRWLRSTATNGTRAEIAVRARRDADLERSLDQDIRRVALERAMAGR